MCSPTSVLATWYTEHQQDLKLTEHSFELWKVQSPAGFLSPSKYYALGTYNITGFLFIVFLSKLLLSAPTYFPFS